MKVNTTFYSLFFYLFLLTFDTNGQENFIRESNIQVLTINGDTMKNPWTGGFNSVQFSEIDLNLDGIKDLFVFDRTGNRISTFINSGKTNQTTYTYDPSYAKLFPKDLKNWVLLRDYNCDGKADIFTSIRGGAGVYANTSSSNLSFLFKDTLFTDNQIISRANLFISSADMPAIDDIDNDGDLDILIPGIIGNRIEYHKNLSIEKYGTCDSLDFQLKNKCWGFFKEETSQNRVVLRDTCISNVTNPEKTSVKDKHLGGTSLLTMDVDSNNSKDLIFGGNSFNDLLLLINEDKSTNLNSSSISKQISGFPSTNKNTKGVNLEHFIAGYYLDINNDGKKDLISSTNSYTNCSNNKNVWLHKNTTGNDNPNFNFMTNSFLQEGMIDVGEGANPSFFDYNADGLMDIVIGNYGIYDSSAIEFFVSSLWLYENTGTISTPSFKLVDTNYANISSLNLDITSNRKTLGISPTFGDLDGDGDEDMIIGDIFGAIHYFENTAGAGNAASFTLNQANYLGIDVSFNAKPQLFDLNKDLLLDLVIGKANGYFSYYENTGTLANPIFSLITDSLGQVSTKRFDEFEGNSTPFIYEGKAGLSILSGSSNGYIYQFNNIDGNLNGTFSTDSTYLDIWEGINSTVSLNDMDNDGLLDLIIGNYSGGIAYYKGDNSVSIPTTKNDDSLILIYPNPSSNILQIETNRNLDAITISDVTGKIVKSISPNTKSINIKDLTQGIYIIKFESNKSIVTKKFVKQN